MAGRGRGAVAIDSIGPVLPTPALEMRSSPSAEPAGRREVLPTPAVPRIGARAPPRWRPPHLQAFPVLPISALETRSSPSAFRSGTGRQSQ